ncbi:MAG: RNA 2',3'-cyclic phosphodiesterase [Candidatus Magasanikbacteria bacterium]|nr:RNA 2',3'-cyclic phosphodiesterase [Candidatus Magasanikbacteria bacterium]
MSRRIFVALKISQRLGEKISDWEKGFPALPVRWLAPRNLHITLIPPWYEDDWEGVSRKLKKLEGLFKEEMRLRFEEVAFGPDFRNPRLIWAKGETPETLLKLKKALEDVLNRKAEKRPFRLHLTLARFRPEEFEFFPRRRLAEKICWQEKVVSFTLMESHLSPRGAEYEALAGIKIGP